MTPPASSRLKFFSLLVPVWAVIIVVAVLVTAGALVTERMLQAPFGQLTGQEANFHCSDLATPGPCPNLYGAVDFRETGYYERTIRQQLAGGLSLTDAFTLDVTCTPPHRPDEAARTPEVNTGHCQAGEPASIVWKSKPDVTIVWYGAYPDHPRQLAGSVGRYDFVVGELGGFELYGSDVSTTEPGQSIALPDVSGPAFNTVVSGPPVSGLGQALIDETGFIRTADNTTSCDGANVYFGVRYELDGSMRVSSFRYERLRDSISTSAIEAGTTANPPAGKDLNWTFGPGVKQLGLSVVDWNGNSIQYSAPFPNGVSFTGPSHRPETVVVCGFDPSPAPAHYHD